MVARMMHTPPNGNYGYWDYQRWNASALNESCLNETAGVNSSSHWNAYGLTWIYYNSPSYYRAEDLTPGSANGPVDWNRNGANNDACASISINYDSDLEVLQATKAEWQLLVFDGGEVGFGVEHGLNELGEPIPVFYTDPLNFNELTLEEDLRLNLHLKP